MKGQGARQPKNQRENSQVPEDPGGAEKTMEEKNRREGSNGKNHQRPGSFEAVRVIPKNTERRSSKTRARRLTWFFRV